MNLSDLNDMYSDDNNMLLNLVVIWISRDKIVPYLSDSHNLSTTFITFYCSIFKDFQKPCTVVSLRIKTNIKPCKLCLVWFYNKKEEKTNMPPSFWDNNREFSFFLFLFAHACTLSMPSCVPYWMWTKRKLKYKKRK